jgi:hypothetical protein
LTAWDKNLASMRVMPKRDHLKAMPHSRTCGAQHATKRQSISDRVSDGERRQLREQGKDLAEIKMLGHDSRVLRTVRERQGCQGPNRLVINHCRDISIKLGIL